MLGRISVLFPMLVQERRGVSIREVPLEDVPEAIGAYYRAVEALT